MKLRKAIDKAKEARKEETPGKSTISIEKKDDTGNNEWIVPTYFESKSVGLNQKAMEENRCVCILPESPEINYYKVLRTQIQQLAIEKKWNTFMITSAHPGEGKTLTSINLALTFAKAFNQTVLLVDCDLQHQTIQKYLGISNKMGLIDYLLDNRQLKDIIVWPGIEKMTLISGGKTIKDSAEFLGSPKMKSLVTEMKTRYKDRFILFDAPPVLSKADAIAFSPLVDGIVMVVENGKTPMQDVKKAVELIPKEKFLGFVLNKKRSTLKEMINNPYH